MAFPLGCHYKTVGSDEPPSSYNDFYSEKMCIFPFIIPTAKFFPSKEKATKQTESGNFYFSKTTVWVFKFVILKLSSHEAVTNNSLLEGFNAIQHIVSECN